MFFFIGNIIFSKYLVSTKLFYVKFCMYVIFKNNIVSIFLLDAF
jgi:hypothetical protein